TFNLSANNTALTNSGTFSLTSCPLNLTGQSSTITNSGSSATFNVGTCPIILSTQNYCNITNGTGSSFLAYGGSSISISSYQGYILNNGNFYAGTSNSACPITLSSQLSYITNSGTFYVGSTSGINLTAYQGLVTNNSSGFFIFQSDAFGSAYVGAIPTAAPASATGQFVGTFQVQRYISGGSAAYRGYRIFSSPVYAATDAYSNNIYSLNYVQSSALVTGSTGAGGGFDKTGNPSLYLFREDLPISNNTFTGGNFWGISKINNSSVYNYYLNGGATTYNIPVGNGFLFWFRGDRTTNLANKYTSGTSAESVTMTATGTLNQGSITVHSWYNPSSATLSFTTGIANAGVRGYVMVGNPYASPIDWETFQQSTTTTGIYGTSLVHNFIYLLNPKTHNYGAYAKGGGGVGTNNATNIIESGQGFIIADSCACSQLIFNESAKTTSQATGLNLFMGKPVENAVMQYLRLQLAEDTVNTDNMLLRFDNTVGAVFSSKTDVPYKIGFGDVSLASMSADHVPLAINTQSFPKTSKTVGLSINTKIDGIYSLSLTDIVGIPQLYDIWLMDAYKKDSLDMRQNKTYSFNVLKSDSATFGSKRFSLVIRQNPAYAYKLLDFTATKAPEVNSRAMKVQVVWKTANEANYTNFTVERSTDKGKTFDVIGGFTASDLGAYSLVDNSPVVGQNLYRLKQEDLNNTISYSNIVPVMYTSLGESITKNNISIYPNPAKSNISLSIVAEVNTAAAYNIQITNSSGILIKQATSNEPNWQANVNELLPGTYMVRVLNNKDNALIGNTKFVKL
ncbi:MAG: T9SS type A sorting domain-containing protein, partial [Mucilaginibacter sp.]